MVLRVVLTIFKSIKKCIYVHIYRKRFYWYQYFELLDRAFFYFILSCFMIHFTTIMMNQDKAIISYILDIMEGCSFQNLFITPSNVTLISFDFWVGILKGFDTITLSKRVIFNDDNVSIYHHELLSINTGNSQKILPLYFSIY